MKDIAELTKDAEAMVRDVILREFKQSMSDEALREVATKVVNALPKSVREGK